MESNGNAQNQTTSNTESRGGRVIIVHAITRDGPLVGDPLVQEQGFAKQKGWSMAGGGRRSSEGGDESSEVTGDVSSGSIEPGKADHGGGHYVPFTRKPTAETLCPAGDQMEVEYSRDMDGEVFMKWFERRLLSASREKYGDNKIILNIDDAPQHHGMAADWKSLLKATKTACAARTHDLHDLGVRTTTL